MTTYYSNQSRQKECLSWLKPLIESTNANAFSYEEDGCIVYLTDSSHIDSIRRIGSSIKFTSIDIEDAFSAIANEENSPYAKWGPFLTKRV